MLPGRPVPQELGADRRARTAEVAELRQQLAAALQAAAAAQQEMAAAQRHAEAAEKKVPLLQQANAGLQRQAAAWAQVRRAAGAEAGGCTAAGSGARLRVRPGLAAVLTVTNGEHVGGSPQLRGWKQEPSSQTF